MRWIIEFNEMGGYDCLTDSIDIKKDGILKVSIDLSLYGQTSCGSCPMEGRAEAEAIAAEIIKALNEANQ